MEQLQVSGLVTTKELYYDANLRKEKYVAKNIKDIRLVEPDDSHPGTGVVRWTVIANEPLRPVVLTTTSNTNTSATPPPALLLRTAGSTPQPRIVPITAEALLYNATCIASTLKLKTPDIGVTATPLHHPDTIITNLLAVLVSGSSMIWVPTPSFDPDVFLDVLLGQGNTNNDSFWPTWYSSVPAIHKVLLMTAKARLAAASSATATSKTQLYMSKHNLRFIRAKDSAGDHLSHSTALELASVFQTKVIPTYGITECSAIASHHDAALQVDTTSSNSNDDNNDDGGIMEIIQPGVPKDTVGLPFGVSVCIVDSQGKPLPYGTVGEVCLKGPGVMDVYVGLEDQKEHYTHGAGGASSDTPWLRTGDVGQLDPSGYLVLAGRSRELIPRGMEEIWPNEIDAVLEALPEVETAVAFGVPNELWGEEVQAAVVLTNPEADKIAMSSLIARTVEEKIGAFAKPSQVLFLDSTDALYKTSSGKILRNRIADLLEVEPTDISALSALKAMAKPYDDTMEQKRRNIQAKQTAEAPSKALNGLRFIAACYVVQHHAGLMPTSQWLKVQAYSMSAMIFFVLAAFQTTVSTKSAIKPNAARFIGTKIGALHAFFIVAHILAMASYAAFRCGQDGYDQKFEDQSCTENFKFYFPVAILNLLTGFFSKEYLDKSNPPAWFQSALYIFFLFFPIFDWHIRNRSKRYRWILLVICVLLGSSSFVLMGNENGRNLVLNVYFYERFLSWVPNLVAAMLVGFLYKEHGPKKALDGDDDDENSNNDAQVVPNKKNAKNGGAAPPRVPLLQRPGFWGVVTDIISFLLLLTSVAVAGAPDCVRLTREALAEARPDQIVMEDDILEWNGVEYIEACDMTRDEFLQYGWSNEWNNGLWPTQLGFFVGDGRASFPLILLWIYGMSFGRGCTAGLFQVWFLQRLAPYAYPLYLLHVPVLRFYWVATRGLSAEFWWDTANFPFPIDAWEVFIVILICVVVAVILDLTIVRRLLPISIGIYVKAYKFLVSCLSPIDSYNGVGEITEESSTFKQVSVLVESLTGNQRLTSRTKLDELGFDSLGATALLGTLRATVPSASTLTMAQLASCETVGDLVFLLEGRD